MNEIVAIAKKEFMDNWRNKWVIAVSSIFVILTLVVSYFGSGMASGSVGWKDLDVTMAGMINLVYLLVPIIGLMLGYAAIVGEREKGSLELLLSYPVKREEVIAGKFIGLGTVMAMANFIGFGIAGIIIGINVKDVAWGDYFIFILSSILLGLVFISIALFFSSIFKKRSTAMGGAIFLWFLFEMIWDIVLAGILLAQYGVGKLSDPDFVAPSYYYIISLMNPVKAYSTLAALNISSISSNLGNLPSFVNTPFVLAILFAWMIVMLAGGYLIFKRKDL